MKSFVACIFLALACLASATPSSYPRGCIYANGRCIQECPVGTLAYSIDCGYVTREATCANSRPKPETRQTCGYSACHCVHPTVRDEKSGQCVHIDRCPQARIIKTHGGGGVPKIQHRPVVPRAPVVPVPPVAPTAPTPPIVNTPAAPQVPRPYYNGYNGDNGYNGYNGYNNKNANRW